MVSPIPPPHKVRAEKSSDSSVKSLVVTPPVSPQPQAVAQPETPPQATTAVVEAPPQDPKGYAASVLDQTQYGCLVSLWNGESGWRYNAYNASSGAYGIPQALPAGKMAAAGADWETNPVTQVKWGLSYIGAVYGTPCNAYYTWLNRSPHWY